MLNNILWFYVVGLTLNYLEIYSEDFYTNVLVCKREFNHSDLCVFTKHVFCAQICAILLYLRMKSEDKTCDIVSACEDFTGWWGTDK